MRSQAHPGTFPRPSRAIAAQRSPTDHDWMSHSLAGMWSTADAYPIAACSHRRCEAPTGRELFIVGTSGATLAAMGEGAAIRVDLPLK